MPGDIQRLVLGQALRLVAAGLAAGLAASAAAGRLVESLLFQVKPIDPETYFGVVVVLAAAGILAGYLPARSASRIDPCVTLWE